MEWLGLFSGRSTPWMVPERTLWDFMDSTKSSRAFRFFSASVSACSCAPMATTEDRRAAICVAWRLWADVCEGIDGAGGSSIAGACSFWMPSTVCSSSTWGTGDSLLSISWFSYSLISFGI